MCRTVEIAARDARDFWSEEEECEGDDTFAAMYLHNEEVVSATASVMIVHLDFPASLNARIRNSRGVTETLTAESLEGFTASWSYDPEGGLSMVVEKTAP